MIFKRKSKRTYLDYAAATPVAKEVQSMMRPYFIEHFGNPSAIHKEGVVAREAVEDARLKVARTLNVRPEGVVFTGGGTEANNLAIYGFLRNVTEGDIPFSDVEIISTKIEHPSILKVLDHLKDLGVTVRYIVLNEYGLIDKKHFESLLSKRTALVTCAYANSEIGVVQDVKRLTRIVRKFNKKNKTLIKVHLDASQAPLWLPCQMDMLGVDLMTLDGGKCYGPKGVGVLARQHGVDLRGIILGGDQEYGLRAGTENTALIVGCAEALVRAQDERKSRSEATASLRDFAIEKILKEIPSSVLNGPEKERLANNVNISILGIDSEFAVVVLDSKGIATSTKSACSGASGNGSSVVREITGDEDRALSTMRFSLGEETTRKELDMAIACLKEHVEKMQSFRNSQKD